MKSESKENELGQFDIITRSERNMDRIQLQYKQTDDGYIIFATDSVRDEKVGHVTGGIQDDTITIDNIQVAPVMRKSGVGSRLIEEVVMVGKRHGMRYLRGEILTEYRLHPAETHDFYEKNGITVDPQGGLFMDLSSSQRS